MRSSTSLVSVSTVSVGTSLLVTIVAAGSSTGGGVGGGTSRNGVDSTFNASQKARTEVGVATDLGGLATCHQKECFGHEALEDGTDAYWVGAGLLV